MYIPVDDATMDLMFTFDKDIPDDNAKSYEIEFFIYRSDGNYIFEYNYGNLIEFKTKMKSKLQIYN